MAGWERKCLLRMGTAYGEKALQPSNNSRESLVDDEDFETKFAVQENQAVTSTVVRATSGVKCINVRSPADGSRVRCVR
jgi:hypothetical protein